MVKGKARGWVWRAPGEVLSRSQVGTHREQNFTHNTDPEHRKIKLGNGIWGVETGSDLLHALIVLIL